MWPETSRDRHVREQEAILASELAVVFVAEAPDGTLQGFAELSLRPHAPGVDGGPVGYLEGWYVVPGARRHGIGRRLVEAGSTWALGRGCRALASDSELGNLLGQRAHAALGFREVNRVVTFVRALSQGGA